MPEVICAELYLIALLRHSCWCRHDSCVQDQNVEAILFRDEVAGGFLNRWEGGEVALDEGDWRTVGDGGLDVFDGFEGFGFVAGG